MDGFKFRQAILSDVKEIQKVEKEYYEGFYVDEKVLKSWMEFCRRLHLRQSTPDN
jgi:hypothetical protein